MNTPKMSGRIIAPDDLIELDQWLLWRYETRNGKTTKVPYQANGTLASSTEPATWTSFERALECFHNPGYYSGVGFVFSASDPFCGIDLDDCLDENGNVKSWAQPIINGFADTYMEVSPSGCGVKIWARAVLPGSGRKTYVDQFGKPTTKDHSDGAIEMYDRGRFFTVTGNQLTSVHAI